MPRIEDNYRVTNHRGRQGAPYDKKWCAKGYRTFSIEWQDWHPLDRSRIVGYNLSSSIGKPAILNVCGTAKLQPKHYVSLLQLHTYIFSPIDGQFMNGFAYTDWHEPRVQDDIELLIAFELGKDHVACPAMIHEARFDSSFHWRNLPAAKTTYTHKDLRINFNDYNQLVREAFKGFVQPYVDWARENVPLVEDRLSKPPLPGERAPS